MKQELEQAIATVCKNVFNHDGSVVLTHPDPQFGDYATNIALQIAKQLGKNPREVAQAIQENISHTEIKSVTIAGPGFINISLSNDALWKLANVGAAQVFEGQIVVTEYSDPNPFKVLHAGHFYTSIVGDSISNLLELAGAEVHRVNFGGDVGLHVGKTLWAIIRKLGGEYPEKLEEVDPNLRSEWMASAYVEGTNAYEDNEDAKQAIIILNKQVYAIHQHDDRDSNVARIYWTCRQWSYDYFNEFYSRIGSGFERYYPESDTAGIGLKTVQDHTGTVFHESNGAVVFKGEEFGLHTRVFVNGEGLPTYETKDVGLIIKKQQDYQFDRSVIITGSEQLQYMSVVLKAVEQFAPELARATTHITHGLVKLQGGVKMSSRKGNILRAVDILEYAAQASSKVSGNNEDWVVLGAVKYAFLRQRIGGDIIYDPSESVSMNGNSGPYLQYAHARARSILSKVGAFEPSSGEYDPSERDLVQKLSTYSDILNQAVMDLLPSHICTYLYELSQVFNRFYENNHVANDPREQLRASLVLRYADTLAHGLRVLGITAPEKM